MRVIDDAVSEGYEVASISGGEPLLYRQLDECLAYARTRGLRTTVTTNGTLASASALASLRSADLVAISLDGVPESHNRMRSSQHAFDRLQTFVDAAKTASIPFGFIFTLTQHNLHELDWVAEFALGNAARLLQVHALEEYGRASEELAGTAPDDVEAFYAFLEVERVRMNAKGRMVVQLDLANRHALLCHPDHVYATSSVETDAPLADLLSPLVVEADGTAVPLQYGFGREYAVGNVRQTPLSDRADVWRTETSSRFFGLCRRAVEIVKAREDLQFFNWYQLISRMSRADVAIR